MKNAPDDAICGHLFRIKPLPTGAYSTLKVSLHNKSSHAILSKLGAVAKDKFCISLTFFSPRRKFPSGSESKAGSPDVRNHFLQSGIDLWELEKQKTQALYIIYSTISPPFTTVTCPFFRRMLQAQNRIGKPSLLHCKSLPEWILAEWRIFEFFAELDIRLCHIYHKGNAFMQLMHDGGTPKNHTKFQALGAQYIQPYNPVIVNELIEKAIKRLKLREDEEITIDMLIGAPGSGESALITELLNRRNDPSSLTFEQKNVAFGFVRSTDGTAPAVAKLITDKVLSVFKLSWTIIGRSCISDWAALAVLRFLEVETEGCEMHNGDKISA